MAVKKNQFYSACAVFFGIVIVMNLAVFPFSAVLSLINLAITLVIVWASFVLIKNYRGFMLCASENVKNLLGEKYCELLDAVPSPVAVGNSEGEIVFYNSEFKKNMLGGEICTDNSVDSFIPGHTAESVQLQGSVQITYNERKFKVSAKKIEDLTIFYFVDNTELKDLKQKYVNSRPCVGFVIFDNKEEIRSSTTDEQASQISISVENTLSEWVLSAGGIIKKLSSGKYFIIFEEKYLKSFVSEKFKIIDKIHTAKIDEHRYATVSMGISRGAETLNEAKAWAKSAVNMSLGRGGDQVTVKNKNSYEFFGGASQGLEKRSKVRTRVVAMALLEKIQSSDAVFIMGHKYSDFDSIGASIGLWSVCERVKKKKSYIIVNKKQTLAASSINHFEKSESDKVFISPSQAESMITENSFLIITDTHSLGFLESADVYKMCRHTAVIDHHRMSVDKIKEALIFYHEPFASSACEMVTELIEYMGDKSLKKFEAECLMAGMMLDTKNFSLKSGIRTFEAAAYLKKKGADSAEIKKMFASSIDAYKTKCKIIEDAHVVENCVIAKFGGTEKNAKTACAQAADELLNIKDVKASFVIFKEGENISISARSLGEINVQVIMEALGGGGHQTMAATQIEGASLEKAEENLIKIIKEKSKERAGNAK